VWHSVCASLNMDIEMKFLLDKMILCSFACFFILFQVIFGISILRSSMRIKKIKEEDIKFVTDLDPKYLEDDYDE
jgi:hypothetical protein